MLRLGDEQTLTLPDGRTWTLGRLELRHIRAFREWIQARVGDPFALVDRYIGKISDEQLMPLLKEAEAARDQLRAFSMGCPLASRFLVTEEGLTFLVTQLLKSAHPEATEDDAHQVAREVSRRLGEILAKAQGTVPNAQGPA